MYSMRSGGLIAAQAKASAFLHGMRSVTCVQASAAARAAVALARATSAKSWSQRSKRRSPINSEPASSMESIDDSGTLPTVVSSAGQ